MDMKKVYSNLRGLRSSQDTAPTDATPGPEIKLTKTHFSPLIDVTEEELIPLISGPRLNIERHLDFTSDAGITIRATVQIRPSALLQVRDSHISLKLLRAMPGESGSRANLVFDLFYQSTWLELGSLQLEGSPGWYIFKNVVDGDDSLQAGFVVHNCGDWELGKWTCTIEALVEEWPVRDQWSNEDNLFPLVM